MNRDVFREAMRSLSFSNISPLAGNRRAIGPFHIVSIFRIRPAKSVQHVEFSEVHSDEGLKVLLGIVVQMRDDIEHGRRYASPYRNALGTIPLAPAWN